MSHTSVLTEILNYGYPITIEPHTDYLDDGGYANVGWDLTIGGTFTGNKYHSDTTIIGVLECALKSLKEPEICKYCGQEIKKF